MRALSSMTNSSNCNARLSCCQESNLDGPNISRTRETVPYSRVRGARVELAWSGLSYRCSPGERASRLSARPESDRDRVLIRVAARTARTRRSELGESDSSRVGVGHEPSPDGKAPLGPAPLSTAGNYTGRFACEPVPMAGVEPASRPYESRFVPNVIGERIATLRDTLAHRSRDDSSRSEEQCRSCTARRS